MKERGEYLTQQMCYRPSLARVHDLSVLSIHKYEMKPHLPQYVKTPLNYRDCMAINTAMCMTVHKYLVDHMLTPTCLHAIDP